MNLSLTKKGILNVLCFFIFATLYTFFLMILLWDVAHFAFIFWIITCLPSVILFVQYYQNEKGRLIVIKNDSIIIYSIANEKKVLLFKDIRYIKLYRSKLMDNEGTIKFLPHTSFSYFEIVFNNNENIIITNLLQKNLDHILILFKEFSIEREYSSFCRLPL